jgi:hypothetical protein
VERIAAVQQMMLGAIETARKSPPLAGRLGFGIEAGLFAGRSCAILPSSSFSILIMTISVIDQLLPMCVNFARVGRKSATGNGHPRPVCVSTATDTSRHDAVS